MLGYDHFYYKTIRAMVASFGFLFSDVQIVRRNRDGSTKFIKVPLHFSSQDKTFQIRDGIPISATFPRMGFDFTVTGVDDLRKTSGNTIHQMKSLDGVHWSRNFIPIDFSFNLYIAANDIEDSLQIVEQILPHFQPALTVKVKPLEDYPDFVTDVTIELVQVSNEFETDGDINDVSLYNWTFAFNLKGFIFSPFQKTGIGVIDVASINVNDWGWLSDKVEELSQ
jgi:hypothetical protein